MINWDALDLGTKQRLAGMSPELADILAEETTVRLPISLDEYRRRVEEIKKELLTSIAESKRKGRRLSARS